jgi:exo-beta-1,3-glucanase (GH17 family)
MTQEVIEKKSLNQETINKIKYVEYVTAVNEKKLMSIINTCEIILNKNMSINELIARLTALRTALKESSWDLKLLVWEIEDILEKLTK